jgi:DNA-binding NtrC family response regulator
MIWDKMAKASPKILLVDDEKKFLNSMGQRLKLLGFDPVKAVSGREAIALAKNSRLDLAIVDLKMPDMDGLVTITKLKEIQPGLRSVLLTGYGNEKIRQATEALDAAYFAKDEMEGFWNFIRKLNMDGNVVVIRPPALSGSFDSGADNREGGIPEPSRTDERKDGPDGAEHYRMIGETLAIQELKRNIERLAALDCTAIIRGETGTGKELAARIIHNLSHRKNSRFIAINCGCFSNDLLVEELFRPGNANFPGGDPSKERPGQSESGGTILLDQIEAMSPKMQLAMLKIIDSNKASRSRGRDDSPFDVRILVASRYRLGQLVEEGKFREELYYRLNVLELFIPPLRERRDDIPPLCRFFLNKFAKEFNKAVEYVSDEVISFFMSYDFPGNVRELEHIVERAVILADGKTIESRHLPGRFGKAGYPSVDASKEIMPLAEMERRYILKALEANQGNKSKTAERLGISRSALWRKLKQFNQMILPP